MSIPKLSQVAAHLPAYFAIFIISTVPILFGAVHPVVQSSYVALVLLGFGGWLICTADSSTLSDFSVGWYLPVLIVLCFIIFQSIPLPLAWVEFLSPARAERVMMVNNLAHTDQQFVSLSDHGMISMQRAILVFSLFIFFIALKQLLRRNDSFVYVIITTIAIVGTVEALYGLFQFLSPRVGILWLSVPSRAAHGTIIYKNQYASFLNMCWPLAVGGAVLYLKRSFRPDREKSRRHRLRRSIANLSNMDKHVPLYCFGTGIMLMAVLFSLSRGGIIAMLLVLVFLAVLLPVGKKKKLIFAGFFLSFIVAYGFLLGLENVITRFDSIGTSGSSRFEIYLGSLQMLWDHWLTGIGLGSYTLLSPIYLEGFRVNIHYDRVHSEYLELMIELGIPTATLLFCWLAAIMLTSGMTLLGKTRAMAKHFAPRTLIAMVAYCGLLGFLIHGLIDFGWRLPANLFYAVTLAALVNYGLENHDV